MKVGMIVSNEPGYYEAGWGGVRLENLYVVATDDDMPAHPEGKRWSGQQPARPWSGTRLNKSAKVQRFCNFRSVCAASRGLLRRPAPKVDLQR